MDTATTPAGKGITAAKQQKEDLEFLWKWRKYLLLLGTLVASVTYAAGLNPPGGVRSDEVPPLPAAYPDRVGDPVLLTTNERRYTAFFYCNAAAFIASLVVIMFLLDRRISDNSVGLTVLRSAMLLDLLALMAAFTAGSCRDVAASAYVSALFALVFACVAVHVHVHKAREKQAAATSLADKARGEPAAATSPSDKARGEPAAATSPMEKAGERPAAATTSRADKFLLLLATFATPLTYGAGLVPPGGFWSQTEAGHLAGAPLLHDGPYKIRYNVFFYANANSFVASLAIIMLLMSRTLMSGSLARSHALPVCVLVELLGLMAAFAAGSCRRIDTTVYVVCLAGLVLLSIVLQAKAMYTFEQWRAYVRRALTCANLELEQEPDTPPGNSRGDSGEVRVDRTSTIQNWQVDKVEESRSLLLLLATLAATVTYQAGLSPPGGVWPDNHDPGHPDHIPGNPILLDMHPKRYKVFYYCNTAAFVASVVIIIIVQSKELSSPATIRRAALKTAMVLNLFGLMGAYVAGSFRDAPTTIYVFSLAVAVFVYSIIKVVAYTHGQSGRMEWMHRMSDRLAKLLRLSDGQPGSEPEGSEEDRKRLERRRKFLLQLAILAATVTYQIGLNPPGGFWPESKGEGSLIAGDPVLLDHYSIRYQVFFYCNATGFMASITVILLLVNQRLYEQGIRSNALRVCVMVGLLGLMGAYAAGSCRQLRTSIYVFALVAAVVTFLVLQTLLFVSAGRVNCSKLPPWLPERLKRLFEPLGSSPSWLSTRNKGDDEQYAKRKYLMLLGILGASVTYQAGLAPPGGTWGDDDTVSSPSPSPPPSASPPNVAGNPILLHSNPARYQAFFYCNATSFMASIVVIMLLLLQYTVKKQYAVKKSAAPLWALQAAVVLDLFGLLGAYTAGSCRDWETSACVIALVGAVVVFITIYALLSFEDVRGKVKELLVCKYFSNMMEKRVWKPLGVSNGDDDQSAAIGSSV
ncbi:uncharacterized protein LOC119333085 [Triticum dicoccoides]|uniref:uncharacterized protein LOC119333085 n=1 Tax=Triticum dicoccoides TaxID=85692 RepID=UPI0018911FC2|nr:uncharacterized protein LOC119333085 [Triticum dicoccoides]